MQQIMTVKEDKGKKLGTKSSRLMVGGFSSGDQLEFCRFSTCEVYVGGTEAEERPLSFASANQTET